MNFDEIEKGKHFQKVWNRLLRFASIRPRSQKELEDWFNKKKILRKHQLLMFSKLKRLNLIGDKKFALWWISQRMEFRPKGRKYLEWELREKGVSQNIIEDVFKNIKFDEKLLAEKVLKKKNKYWRNLDSLDVKRKKIEFLRSKGFSWETIKEVLKLSE